MVSAIRRLGVDARVGAVAGEYCPGAYSVNARGSRKLMGVGQRIVAGAAHVGGVVVVGGSRRIRDVLLPVYDALSHDWKPSTVGSIEDELGVALFEDARQAIIAEFASRYDVYDGALSPAVVDLAEKLEPEHEAG